MGDRYTSRTVEWGNWGITFMEPQPDRTKNHGLIVGTLYFPVGSRGPIDSDPRGPDYRAICRNWTELGILPAGLVARAA